MKFFGPAFLSALLMCSSLRAADINITAEQKVEWHQKSQTIIAIGDAVATKEDMTVKADRLIGHYAGRENTTKGKSSITRVEAVGSVKMHSPRADAFGDNLDYNLVQDVAVLTGKPAKIKTAQETITAEDNITYYPSKQEAVAFGNVLAIDKDNNKLHSDKMVAYFKKEANNSQNLTLDQVKVFGNVKIVTPDTVVTGDRGLYLPRTGIVKLFDNVIIRQDGNILRGDKAETDLNTGVSKLLSGGAQNRVKGVFKEKKQEDKKSPVQPQDKK